METSKEMINELLSYVDSGSFCLEPSAGKGAVAIALKHKKDCKVDVCELSAECLKILQKHSHLYNDIYHGNFLGWINNTIVENKYDFVVAVPPYKDNCDCEHIMTMYHCVKKGGKVITFTLPYWVTGFYSNQVKFREWLSDKKYTMKLFNDDQSYLGCPKMLLIIEK